ncbi:MAG: M50 family metallopeptidase [Gemmatimonadota bacterium]|nr:M50 family metallopeptidase [Gemmatimonadota bacterium]MDE3006956.1 M50 family metallopeptidase [Gemmatimonadota bacterium]MDE3014819.1 M50 family metallopeptidase [Gemmatimonadota bacterium]
MNGKLRFIMGFGLFFTGLWFLWDTPIVYPLKIFVVLLHELSHAMAVWATGGTVDQITLDPYQGGATYFTGGSAVLAMSAGYLGSLFWGALMFRAANEPRVRKDWVNGAIGAMVILLTVFFVRSGFGIAFGIFFGAAMITASRRIGEIWNKRLLLTLGLTSALYAILDIKDDVLDRPEIRSDAWMLAETTGIGNATMWGALWIFIAIFVSTRLMMRAFEDA